MTMLTESMKVSLRDYLGFRVAELQQEEGTKDGRDLDRLARRAKGEWMLQTYAAEGPTNRTLGIALLSELIADFYGVKR